VELLDFNQHGMFDRSNLSRGTVLRVYQKGAPDEERTRLWGCELISLGDELFVPMAPFERSKPAAPLAVDFTSAALQSLLERPGVSSQPTCRTARASDVFRMTRS
jgi:hypothetical protein